MHVHWHCVRYGETRQALARSKAEANSRKNQIMAKRSTIWLTISAACLSVPPTTLIYRNFHSRKVAASLCLVLWIYVNAVILPGIVERMREFKQPLEVIGCSAQYQSRIWEQVVVYCVSELIMVIAFPIALYKRRRRQKTRQAPHAIVVHAAEGSVATGRTATTGAMDSSHMPVDPVPVMPQTNRHADRSYGFTVLVLLTCSVITCWTPASVAFLVASILHTRYPTIFQVAISLFDVVPVLDPILLTVAMKDLRKAMIDHLHAATRGRRWPLHCFLHRGLRAGARQLFQLSVYFTSNIWRQYLCHPKFLKARFSGPLMRFSLWTTYI